MTLLSEFLGQHSDKVSLLLKSPPKPSQAAENHDTKSIMHSKLFFILDGVLPFLQASTCQSSGVSLKVSNSSEKRSHMSHNSIIFDTKSQIKYIVAGSNENFHWEKNFRNWQVRCFIDPNEKKLIKKYAKTYSLPEQMAISAVQSKQPRPNQPTSEQLDVRCLQILRATIHNEEKTSRGLGLLIFRVQN
ncbi:hypothetical protein Btru_072534 [Bulinus truncatus]|nr:hypothetical protein Btru_072534 [Bulinus truncatus]